MTLEQENEMQIFSRLFLFQGVMIKSKIFEVFADNVITNRSEMFERFWNFGFFNAADDMIVGTAERPAFSDCMEHFRQYTLNCVGVKYLNHLVAEKEKENLLLKQIQADIDWSESVKSTNLSIQDLNSQTEKFYKFQRSFTIVITVATSFQHSELYTP